MNWAHIHLMSNHFPVVGLVFGTLLLFLALLRKSEELKRVSFGIFILIALITFLVYFSGEPAEEIVEHLPGVKESIIEQHEEIALVSLIFIEILGIMAAAGLFLSLRSTSKMKWLVTALFILSIVSGGLIIWTANLGGQIRHTEIRKDFQFSPSESGQKWDKERYGHDDD